ncbi:MAG: hypothetical protein KatS3mg015_1922 [Fimbriimonadales bacterium]|nr:MAG: hypothetical protein KatS3mg015_1922 [Fimbriimonadales bacterium]
MRHKSMRKPRFVLLGTGLALALTLAASQDAIVLKRELKAGAKEAYTMSAKSNMVMDMGQAGMGTMPFDFSYQARMEINFDRISTDGKEANITITMKDLKFDMGQMGQMMGGQQPDTPEEVTMKGTLDTRNRIRGVQMPNAPGPAMMFSQMTQNFPLFIEFPNDPVRVGDSWEVRIPANPMTGNKMTRLKATLIGEKSAGQGTAWAIKLTGTINVNADMGAMMRQMGGQGGGMPDMAMLMTGTMTVDGEALIEKETGRTIKFETTYKSDLTMDFPDMGMQMKQSGNTVMSVVLANN